jgi:hypothetical protein
MQQYYYNVVYANDAYDLVLVLPNKPIMVQESFRLVSADAVIVV